MNLFSLLPLIAFFANILIGSFIIYRNPKNPLNISFMLFSGSLAIWSLSHFLVFTAPTESIALFWDQLSLIGVCFTPVTLLHFILLFSKSRVSTSFFIFVFYLPGLIFLILGLTTGLMVQTVIKTWWGYHLIDDILLIPLSLYNVSYVILAIVICYNTYIVAQTKYSILYIQARNLIIALLIPLIGGILTQVVLPILDYIFIPLTSSLSTITTLIIYLTIKKHKLFEFSNYSVRKKAMTLVVTLIIIASLSTLIPGYVLAERNAMTNTRDSLESSLLITKSHIETYLEEHKKFVSYLANENIFKSILNPDESQENKYRQVINAEKKLNDILTYFPSHDFNIIKIIDKQGNTVISSSDVPFGKYVVSNELVVSNIFRNPTTGNPIMMISSPIYDNDDIMGHLISSIDLETFYNILTKNPLKFENTVIYLLNTEGVLISPINSNNEDILNKQFETKNYQRALLHVYSSDDETQEKHSDLLVYTNHDGVEVIGTHTYLHEIEAILVIEQETSVAFLTINTMKTTFVIIFIVLLLIGIIISYFASKILSKPIRHLHDAVKKIKEGSLDVEITAQSKDEIGELSKSFSQMMHKLKESRDKIEEYNKTLENQVHERTLELEQSKKQLEIHVENLQKSKTALMNIMDDLTKSKEDIRNKNIELQKLDKLKSDFLNNTSHELRTPMTAMKGYLQMLIQNKMGSITKEQRKALAIIERNTTRLDSLVQDILDTSRLESGTMKFIPMKTNIDQLIEEIIDTMKISANIKSITIQKNIEDNLPDLIVDKYRIVQVLNNLINNAIKFSPEGSVINIIAKKENQMILFEVHDFGIGIPQDKKGRIFDVFYQVDSGVDRTFGGTGLGLTISRGIILGHGGNLWVESEENKGSQFKFTLPLKPIQDIEGTFKKIDIFDIQNKNKP